MEIPYSAISAEARALAAETALLVKKYGVLEEQVVFKIWKIFQYFLIFIIILGANIDQRIETSSTCKSNSYAQTQRRKSNAWRNHSLKSFLTFYSYKLFLNQDFKSLYSKFNLKTLSNLLLPFKARSHIKFPPFLGLCFVISKIKLGLSPDWFDWQRIFVYNIKPFNMVYYKNFWLFFSAPPYAVTS